MSCKHCKHCTDEAAAEAEEAKKPRVWTSTSTKEGGCNFCMRTDEIRRVSNHDPGGYRITIVKSPAPCGLVVRICDDCKERIAKG